MTNNALDAKSCTGYLCDKTAGCPYYQRKSANPFNYISPLSFHSKCPYWPVAEKSWGEGAEDMTR